MLTGQLIQTGKIFYEAALSQDAKATPADRAVNKVDLGFSSIFNEDVPPFQVVVNESVAMKFGRVTGNLFAHGANPVAVM